MDAGAEIEMDPPVDGDSSAAESGFVGKLDPSPLNQGEILRTLATVEKDSKAIAESFSSLFVSLRSTLSEATGSSVDHMTCFGDAAGRLQEPKAPEERNVDVLDTAVNKLLRPP
ncbi:eukaryotic translation initiation factor 3A [Raphanus sativus]|nr:eukaryotic translation initiation factor 3A [Raphanus sativus]